MQMRKRSKRILFPFLVLLGALLLAGCLDVDTTITVKPDGSGSVEQTFLMQSDILAMLKSMGGEDGGDFSLMDTEELESNARAMGKGVELESAEPYERNGFEGYKAVYSFDDISNLRVNQNPGDSVPDAGPEEGEDVKEFITFDFKKGNRSTLTINLPQEPGDADSDEAGEGVEDMPDSQEMDMIKQLYENMQLSMKVAVDGNIRKTNATHRNGSTLTLMEMDFGKIFGSKDTFEKLAKSNPQSLEEIKGLVDDVPGIKVELNETVTVEFD